jgi:outer membrane protein TolC
LEVAQKKYETGTGLQQDVLRAQVEFSKLEDELIMWQQKRQAAVANLNALLNRPANQKISKVTDIVIHTQDSEPTMDKPIEEIRPLLRSWKITLQKADKTIKLAEKQYWPNFTIGASYTQRDDLKSGMIMHDFFSASISLNIPLYLKRKQSNQVQEKQFSLMSVREEYQNIKNRVYADLENTKAELTRYKKQIQLYNEGVILQAGQSLESARAGYQVNKVDFLTVINNWMNLQLYELQLHKAIANYHKSYAKYQFITGNTKN